MIKLDDAISMTIATPQRPLADHASRNWQAVLEREWLEAWPAPMPSVPERGNSNGSTQLSPDASAPLAATPEGAASVQPGPTKVSQPPTAEARSSTTSPPLASTPATASYTSTSTSTQTATTSGTGHTAVPTTGGTVSGQRQVAVTAMARPASPVPTEQIVWGAAVYAASLTARPSGSLPQIATTVGTGRIEPLPPAQAPSLGTVVGVALPQAESAEVETPSSAPRSAKSGLSNTPHWESALRLASPEDGKVQAVLRDASLSQEGAHHVATNLSGTLASMGFEAIRIYVNGKQYGAGKDTPQPTRSARAGITTMPTVSLVSKVKE